MTRACLLWPIAAGALLLGGCGGDDLESSEDDISESQSLFGADRVADKLKGKTTKIPGTFQEVEKLFGIGRACVREDSKEIFVVEESATRAGGVQSETDGLLPRAVITGCSTDPDVRTDSFNLMVALFSSPDAPDAEDGDPMILSPVEMMALDRKTGLYNFYVFESNGKGKTGTLNRIQLQPDDTVVRFRKEPSKSVKREVVEDRACNNCHANMGPLMNELTEPWTNWVSTHKRLPETDLGGETASIVAEAGGGVGRASFANELERTMRDAMRVWLDGTPEVAGSGFGQAALDGDVPGKLPELLRSVFCETELNYANAFETVPVDLFFDPTAVAGGGFLPPGSDPLDIFPVQLPVRSEIDKRVERFLMRQRFLSVKTMTAIRLVDETADVFSAKRCGLWDKAVKKLPADPAAVDAKLREVVGALLKDGSIPAGPRATYMKALLDPAASSDTFKKAQAAYFTDALARYKKDTALLKTSSGRTKLKKRVTARKDAARAMFPGDASPLPVLDPDQPPKVSKDAVGKALGFAGVSKAAPFCPHDACDGGEALDSNCSTCTQDICDLDSFCCSEGWDDTCTEFAVANPECGC